MRCIVFSVMPRHCSIIDCCPTTKEVNDYHLLRIYRMFKHYFKALVKTCVFFTLCTSSCLDPDDCRYCRGKGDIPIECEFCTNGYKQCQSCIHSPGYSICKYCNAGKQWNWDKEAYVVCSACNGNYRKTCIVCRGNPLKKCEVCKAKRVPCPKCDGTGKITPITPQ